MKRPDLLVLCCTIALLSGCSEGQKKATEASPKQVTAAPSYVTVDPATAGTLTGKIKFTGKRPAHKLIDMSDDPACVAAHHGKASDESITVNGNGTLANVFIYLKSGLEGKTFAVPATPVVIDQNGCWFHPRVMGIQTGQTLQVINSDPVTHNVHPMAQINREWNHSQGQGDTPLARKFIKPEIMIRVKCNIHSWMRAFIGVVEHPYFAVSTSDGTFEIRNIPPGEYVLAAWQETLGTQEQKISVTPSGKIQTSFTFKGE
jgi:plastocyanin